MIDFRSSVKSIAGLAGASFVLNFAWEMIQAPWFADMAGLSLWAASRRCLLATFGDVAIILVAYTAVSAWIRQMNWVRHARPRAAVSFGMIAFGLSTVIERHAIATGRWRYVSEMPLVPWLEIGVAPAAQWLLLPFLVLALARRIAGSSASDSGVCPRVS